MLSFSPFHFREGNSLSEDLCLDWLRTVVKQSWTSMWAKLGEGVPVGQVPFTQVVEQILANKIQTAHDE